MNGVRFLFGYYPYDEIVFGDEDAEGYSCFALLYDGKIVGLGRRQGSHTSPSSKVYVSVIDQTERTMINNIYKLRVRGDAEMSLCVLLKGLKIASRDSLPEPEPKLVYEVYGKTEDKFVRFEVYQYRWYNKHSKYLLGYRRRESLDGEFKEILQTDKIREVSSKLSELTDRKINLL